jgi:4-hydroxybenzoate polyprenyltransferase
MIKLANFKSNQAFKLLWLIQPPDTGESLRLLCYIQCVSGGIPNMDFSNKVLRRLQSCRYHLYTFWLFVFSDLKTIVVPSTIFGITNGWAAPKYGLHASSQLVRPQNTIDLLSLIGRGLTVLLWVVINFIPFAINNQRGEQAVAEDLLNKPWRPFPSHRISHKYATRIMVALYIFAPLYSMIISGGTRHSGLLIILGLWYNNWGGADNGPIVRNVTNALGYTCFVSGAMEVFLGGSALPLHSGELLGQWHLVITAVIFSTVHLQDMSDQPGDAQRGRRTAPLVWGDGFTRWTIAVPLVTWGVACPMFWGVSSLWYFLSASLACTVAVRVLFVRGVPGDQKTFRTWNWWIAVVYMLPLFSEVDSTEGID